ncbi:beta-ketoacyl-[acyl-carrier-protein] synthase family protein [Microbacterium sp.]|uniref:beta-ketoacyl-[acyl-carrier-protein] synthase family protein n=1 Tax=Microbacterium sp. TaxID=51671 RepID=UPI003A85E7DE
MSTPSTATAVTGIGMISPAGIGRDANWATILAGAGTAASHESIDHHGQRRPIARVPEFDARKVIGASKAWRLARFVQLAIIAAREAISDSGVDLDSIEASRIGLVFGNSLGGTDTLEAAKGTLLTEGAEQVSPMLVPMWMPNMVAGSLAIEFGIQGPAHVVATACASGTTAIGHGRQLLRDGRCDIVVVGASESALSPATLAGLANMGALVDPAVNATGASRPFDSQRGGFVPAEGAAALVLERDADARARDARVYAHVAGYGASTDAHHVTAPRPDGEGLQAAVREAVEDDAGLALGDISHVNAHGTSTPLNDASEGAALHGLFGDRVPVTSIKGVTGHPLAAAGAIEGAIAALTVHHGQIPPTANTDDIDPAIAIDVVTGSARPLESGAVLSVSAGFGGHNAAVVFTP